MYLTHLNSYYYLPHAVHRRE